jgi:hypothetical protein
MAPIKKINPIHIANAQNNPPKKYRTFTAIDCFLPSIIL